MSVPFSLNMAGYGRSVINQFASSTLGLTDTAVNHKFGCAGYCGNPTPNTMTLVDAERIYTAIATNGSILDPAHHNSEGWAYIPGTVQAAVKELLRPGIRAALQTWGPGLTLAIGGAANADGFSQRASQSLALRDDASSED